MSETLLTSFWLADWRDQHPLDGCCADARRFATCKLGGVLHSRLATCVCPESLELPSKARAANVRDLRHRARLAPWPRQAIDATCRPRGPSSAAAIWRQRVAMQSGKCNMRGGSFRVSVAGGSDWRRGHSHFNGSHMAFA